MMTAMPDDVCLAAHGANIASRHARVLHHCEPSEQHHFCESKNIIHKNAKMSKETKNARVFFVSLFLFAFPLLSISLFLLFSLLCVDKRAMSCYNIWCMENVRRVAA
ncbi:MAG: hypothetical protein IJD75_00265 [Clostridia bacterium]|nr:hypothetical protein [Clostridia bacterium]